MTTQSADTLLALAQSPLLRGIDARVLASLDPPPDTITISAGETLVRQGDTRSDYFLVASGRLRTFEQGADGRLVQVGDVLPGEGIGEDSLFTGAPSPVTVIARVDSTVIRFPQAMFLVLVAGHPMAALTIAATVIERARNAASRRSRICDFPAIAVVSLSPGIDAVALAHDLVSELGRYGRSVMAPPGAHGDHDRLLRAADTVVYAAGPHADASTHGSIVNADLVLFVVDATLDDGPGEIEREIVSRLDRHIIGRADVLIRHPSTWHPHCGTSRWLDRLPVDEHHHVRAGNRADLARVARIILGCANNVVLSGGGARAFAQVGVLRALEEFGVPIDRVAGTSMGAGMAALRAIGDDFDSRVRQLRDLFLRRRPGRDFTLPLLSLLAGKRMNRIGMDLFDPWQIEDLPLRFFCVSSDLGRGELVEHFRGELWMAIRATAAMPVVSPPFAHAGRMLVDGGVLNNLPVDVMKQHFTGRLIAVDASEHRPLVVDAHWDLSCPSGFDILRRNLNPFRTAASVPTIFDVLRRTATLSSERQSQDARRMADLLIVPPVASFSLTDFGAFDRIVEIGYRHAHAQLSARAKAAE